MLAGLAFRQIRQPKVWILGIVLAVSLVMALGSGTFLYGVVMKFVPGLGLMRYPIKFVVLAVLILPLLAAMGVKRFSIAPGDTAARDRRWLIIGTVVSVCAIGAILWFAKYHPRYTGSYNHWGATLPTTLLRSQSLCQLRLPLPCAAVVGSGGRCAPFVRRNRPSSRPALDHR